YGEAEHIRELAQRGTLIMVPTHFSNLDSVLIGWVIHVLGLPPLIYGAGLNLFNIKLFAYFLNSVGAYKVDRRKKNFIYIETLKMYSHLALMKGAHSLFFPGGTRSRSGRIEKKLKRGLLGTAIEAQRSFLMGKNAEVRKIFIVPVTINYHFVLEAPTLINEHLKATGQERYYREQDEYSTSYKIFKFMVKFFTKGSNISVSLGRPMDVLGNYVGPEGESLDAKNRVIQIDDYFKVDGKITENIQREAEYTRMLSERIVNEFHRINRVFASHLVAFVAFRYWEKQNPHLDLFSLLRLPEEDLEIDYETYKKAFSETLEQVMQLYEEGKLHISNHLTNDIDTVIRHGLDNVGLYHMKRPLLLKKGKIITQNMTTLYYYHNRMDGYGL
ncbi:MAG: 1-acyl-sn-glycerol-3-phosphate acyltransferase, partial [Cyclobacteriaceae bacterium]|nr:1-acyl-sn-glycerol-3-phosphate acyltransferase [Cyclobacteriaceae bacterium]